MALSGLISIHDVMPETRERVTDILERIAWLPPAAVTLLVVPGKDWRAADLDWLRDLSERGYPLAGHGWRHGSSAPAAARGCTS